MFAFRAHIAEMLEILIFVVPPVCVFVGALHSHCREANTMAKYGTLSCCLAVADSLSKFHSLQFRVAISLPSFPWAILSCDAATDSDSASRPVNEIVCLLPHGTQLTAKIQAKCGRLKKPCSECFAWNAWNVRNARNAGLRPEPHLVPLVTPPAGCRQYKLWRAVPA